jgi:tetraacyldisaccharide 4'-kinase
MKTPSFWYQAKPSLIACLLAPLGFIYGAVTAHRMKRKGLQAKVPVLCVGNFTAGGSGKTPTALMIADIVRDFGHKPFFLSRGYGGNLSGPILVDPSHHNPADTGDEPFLLASKAPTIVSRNRLEGAQLAQERGASLIIMDDGLQNPSLIKTWTLVVVDGETGFGNHLCIPAGPLRAPPHHQWKHADAVLIIGRGARSEEIENLARQHNKPVFYGVLKPDPVIAQSIQGQEVAAMAGIGRPEKFKTNLQECGAIIRSFHPFPDHHAYQRDEMVALMKTTKPLPMLITEKDWIKIKALNLPEPLQERLVVLAVSLQLEEPENFHIYLEKVITPPSS